MKRIGNLKHIWTDYDVLFQAFCEVCKNKSYKPIVIRYEMNMVSNLLNLQKSLIDSTYFPREPKVFTITEPKQRLIQAPHFEDRIVQHALLIAVRNIIERKFIFNSFACRKTKGTLAANDALVSGLRNFKDEGYYLKIDVKKFFYSINHNKLTNSINKIIKCKDTVDLLKLFYVNDDGKGLPLGNVTSQVLANLALTPIDNFCKHKLKIKYYYRYMDDIIILHDSKERLKEILSLIIAELENKCSLELNNKTMINKIKNGVDFVGYKTWYNRRVIRKRSLYNIKRKLKKEVNKQRISSFLSHSKRTNSMDYVADIILKNAKEEEQFIKQWYKRNVGENYAIL